MNGLKESLEEAIKEMQEAPVAPQGSSEQPADLRLTRAVDALQMSHQVPERASAPIQASSAVAGTRMDFTPSNNSIEAALSSAPAVSPHYVPPEPEPIVPPILPVHSMPASSFVASREPVAQKPSPKQPASSFEQVQQSQPKVRTPAREFTSTLLPFQSFSQKRTPEPNKVLPGVPDRGDFAAPGDDVIPKTKKQRDNIWRWTTIGISCVGGLASGWLGSNMSDQNGGIFKSDVQTIVGQASKTASLQRPATIRIRPTSAEKMMSGIVNDSVPDGITGKTDRAFALDEELCTVLELDRGTGLTLAKPCKPIETAEFNSTLGKADLLVRSK